MSALQRLGSDSRVSRHNRRAESVGNAEELFTSSSAHKAEKAEGRNRSDSLYDPNVSSPHQEEKNKKKKKGILNRAAEFVGRKERSSSTGNASPSKPATTTTAGGGAPSTGGIPVHAGSVADLNARSMRGEDISGFTASASGQQLAPEKTVQKPKPRPPSMRMKSVKEQQKQDVPAGTSPASAPMDVPSAGSVATTTTTSVPRRATTSSGSYIASSPPTVLKSSLTSDHNYLFKIITIGNSGVGKTSIITRLVDDVFRQEISTIGFECKTKTVEIQKKGWTVVIKMQIWDTAGQEKFGPVISSYYRGTDGVIVMYDITNEKSFYDMDSWLLAAQDNSRTNPVVMVIGNKLDLASKRAIKFSEAKAYCEQRKFFYTETSASTGQGVESAFEAVAEYILEQKGFMNTVAAPHVAGSRIGSSGRALSNGSLVTIPIGEGGSKQQNDSNSGATSFRLNQNDKNMHPNATAKNGNKSSGCSC